MRLVPEEKLRQLIDGYQRCVAFANLCQERVMLFEAYKADADATIKAQEEQILIGKEQIESEKRKSWLIPVALFLLGGAAGFFIAK